MWCGVVRCGVVWCGAVWCGVVWCGVVWYRMLRVNRVAKSVSILSNWYDSTGESGRRWLYLTLSSRTPHHWAIEARYREGGRQDCLFVACLSSQQHASVSQGRICTEQFDVLPH